MIADELHKGERPGGRLLRASDPDEAIELTSGVFNYPHRLEVRGSGEGFGVTTRVRRAQSVTIAVVRYESEVLLRPERVEAFYQINLLTGGYTLAARQAQEVRTVAGDAMVQGPDTVSSLRCLPRRPQVGVSINRTLVDRVIAGILGHPPDDTVQFQVGLDLSRGPGLDWLRSISQLRDAIDSRLPDFVLRPLEELVVGRLLLAQPHNFSTQLSCGPRPIRPQVLSRVIELIDDDPAATLTVSDMARVARTSVRSLQVAFADHLGVSPTEYLRSVRLRHAHQDLLATAPGDGRSVADIAYRWGFGHVPRFAAVYRDCYGVAPSQTLRS